MRCCKSAVLVLVFATVLLTAMSCGKGAFGDDYFLTIGGGYSPSGNQVSLEKNVLYFQRVLGQCQLQDRSNTILFADGDAPGNDLQVIDRSSVPEANRLMAEFFGSQSDLGLYYRNHEVPNVAGATSAEHIREWFREVGGTMTAGDRLVLYVAAHGSSSRDKQSPHNTAIMLWNRQRFAVSELVELLDGLPDGVEFVTIMVQCHAGGFARCIFNAANPDEGLSPRKRCGFFATVYDRPAAGCTPEIDEAGYVEYSTYFWQAICGVDRLGQSIELPDYDHNGTVTFDEAHAYTVLHSDTIDLPVKTSGEFLRSQSRFGDTSDADLLGKATDWDLVVKVARSSDRAVLEGLAERLGLSGSEVLADARQKLSTMSRETRSSSRFRSRGRSLEPHEKLKQKIASDLKHRWPELNNLLNPLTIELVTDRSDDFVRAVKQHPDYQAYCREVAQRQPETNPRKQRVRFERLIRTAENVILEENLRRLGDADRIAEFESIVAAERGSLGGNAEALPHVAAVAE